MVKDRKNKDGDLQFWRCVNRACRGRAKSSIADGLDSLDFVETSEHTVCEPNPALVKKKERVRILKELAQQNPTTPAGRLIEQIKICLSSH
jgi:hypothetical protein